MAFVVVFFAQFLGEIMMFLIVVLSSSLLFKLVRNWVFVKDIMDNCLVRKVLNFSSLGEEVLSESNG